MKKGFVFFIMTVCLSGVVFATVTSYIKSSKSSDPYAMKENDDHVKENVWFDETVAKYNEEQGFEQKYEMFVHLHPGAAGYYKMKVWKEKFVHAYIQSLYQKVTN